MSENKVMFYDRQTGGYSRHTSVDGLADMLIEDWLTVVHSSEDFEGEFNEESKKWGKATQEEKRDLIEGHGYEIIDNPSDDDIYRWELYHNDVWNDNGQEI